MKIIDKRLTKNAVRCNKCLEVIESIHRHDFRWCKCGSTAVDGGLAYERRTGTADGFDFTELSEYIEFEREEHDWEIKMRKDREEYDRKMVDKQLETNK